MMSSKKKIGDESKLFYSHNKSKIDDEIEDEFEYGSNSILIDQIDKFKKRNHYLRKSFITIDSANRETVDRVISKQIQYTSFAFLMNNNAPNNLYIYHPNHPFSTNTNIYLTNIAKNLNNLFINNIPIVELEYNISQNAPIFYIYPVSNKSLLDVFKWNQISNIVSYTTEYEFINSDTPNFYYFNYKSSSTSEYINDFILKDSTKRIKIFQVSQNILGYPDTSYFKINLSKSLYNIHSMKLLDIKLPNIIFNINNGNYSFGQYKFQINSKFRFIVKSDVNLVSNVEYVGNRINYDLFNKKAIIDVNNYSNNYYQNKNKNVYPNIYLATDIFFILTDIINGINDDNTFYNLSNKNIFELAYFYLIQYNKKLETFSTNSINNIVTNDKLYYIYTLDIINDLITNKNIPILIKPQSILNNKMPLIYSNDYILYVNNDSYKMEITTINWMDNLTMKLGNMDKYTTNTDSSLFFNLYMHTPDNVKILIGKLQDLNISNINIKSIFNGSLNNFDPIIQYNVGVSVSLSNFNPTNYSNIYEPDNINKFYARNTKLTTNIEFINNNDIISYAEYKNGLYYFNMGYYAETKEKVKNILRYGYEIYRLITKGIIDNNQTINTDTIQYIIGIRTDSIIDPAKYVNTNIKAKPIDAADTEQNYITNKLVKYIGDNNGIYYFYAEYSGLTLKQYMELMYLSGYVGNLPYYNIYDDNNSFIIQSVGNLPNTTISLTNGYYTYASLASHVASILNTKLPFWYSGNTPTTTAIGWKCSYNNNRITIGITTKPVVNFETNITLTFNSLSVKLFGFNNLTIFISPYILSYTGTLNPILFPYKDEQSANYPNIIPFTITSSYEKIGIVDDIIVNMVVEPYKTEFIGNKYITTPTTSKSKTIIQQFTTKNNIAGYTIQYIQFDNKMDGANKIVFQANIVSNGIYDANLDVFFFNISIKTDIDITDIHFSKNYQVSIFGNEISILNGVITTTPISLDDKILGTALTFYYNPCVYSILFEKENNFQIEYLNNSGFFLYIEDSAKFYNYSTQEKIFNTTNTTKVNEQNTEIYDRTTQSTTSTIYELQKLTITINKLTTINTVKTLTTTTTTTSTETKTIYTNYNRNYIKPIPSKYNMQNLETYLLYPIYEISIDNGYYDDIQFINVLEKKLNNINYQKFNYFKKQLEEVNITNELINNPDYMKTEFKVFLDTNTKKLDIKCFKKMNHSNYNIIFDSINPYLFININNSVVQNNQRLFIKLNKTINSSNVPIKLTDTFANELSVRILPTFQYSIRIMYPINIDKTNLQYEPLINDIEALLRKTSFNPNLFRRDYPNLRGNSNYSGISLLNQFNNSYSYTNDVIFNSGIINNIELFETCIVINNVYYQYESYKMGRITKITDKFSNKNGNYRINIQMTGDTKISHPFFVGDIVYFFNSKIIAMIVPNEWGMFMEYPEITKIHNQLPTYDIIRSGYKNYLKLLYQYTNKQYLLDMINKFNLQSFNFYKFDNQNENTDITNYNKFISFNYWSLQQVKNSECGFEIYFEYDKSFQLTNLDIDIDLLFPDKYSLFSGKNQNGEYDTPYKILGLDTSELINQFDYQNNTEQIDWRNNFNNEIKYNLRGIKKMYFTYGSDNMVQNKIYIEVSNIKDYNIGDKVYLDNIKIKSNIQRDYFNMYNSNIHNVKSMISFEMYLSFIVYRLALIQLGVPIQLGPNDVMNLSEKSISDMISIVNNNYFINGITDKNQPLVDFIISNHRNTLVANNLIISDLTSNIEYTTPNLSSNNISSVLSNIINKFVFKKILPWFINENNLLIWTKGDRDLYTDICNNYIDITNKNIYRFELECIDKFIFKSNIDIYDNNSLKIGKTLKTSIDSDYYIQNNKKYIIYILLNSNYTNISNLINGSFIFTIDKKYINKLTSTIIKIDDNNKGIYLYDTYLKFKTILQIVPSNINTQDKALNFNQIDNIETIYTKLYNLNNQNIDSFKNGYQISIYKNNVFNNQDKYLDEGSYRVMINMIDTANLLKFCYEDLNIAPTVSSLKISNPNQADLIRIIDIYQLLVDLNPINNIMINLDWTIEMDNNIMNLNQYQIRRMDNIFSICGSKNFYIENIQYDNKFIYGSPENPNGLIIQYYNNLFKKTLTDDIIKTAFTNNTIDNNTISSICTPSNYNDILDKLTIFTNNQSEFLYGFLWFDSNMRNYGNEKILTDKEVFIILPNIPKIYETFNRCNLNNFIILFNFIYVDQLRNSNIENMEYNQDIQNNVIETCEPVILNNNDREKILSEAVPKYTKNNGVIIVNVDSLTNPIYRIFKIKLKFKLKHTIYRGTPFLIKDYYTTLYKKQILINQNPTNNSIKGQNVIFIKDNWSSGNSKEIINLEPGTIIKINYGSYNPIFINYVHSLTSLNSNIDTDDNLHEETNMIVSVDNFEMVSTTKYWKITLKNPIKYEFKNDLPVILMINPTTITTNNRFNIPIYEPVYKVNSDELLNIYNKNNIICNCLSTQNIIVNDEWYTKIFYQSEQNIDIYGINKCGISAFNSNCSKKINISGMKGIVIPNLGFQAIERTNFYNNVDTETEQNNKYIKPIPDGIYSIEMIQKEDNLQFLQHSIYDIPIPGIYEPIYNSNNPEQTDEWIDNYINYRWVYFTLNKPTSNDNILNNLQLFYYGTDTNATMDLILTIINGFKTQYKNSKNNDIYKCFVKLNNTNLVSGVFTNCGPSFPKNRISPNNPYDFKMVSKTNEYIFTTELFMQNESYDCSLSNLQNKIYYNNVIIKGRYQGFGGVISIENNNNDIFNNIEFEVSSVNTDFSIIELDLENNKSIFTNFYPYNNSGDNLTIRKINKPNYNHTSPLSTQINPIFSGFTQIPYQYSVTNSNMIIDNYNIIPSKIGYITRSGNIFKKKINKLFSTDIMDYIFLCFKNIDSKYIVEQNNKIGDKIIFSKIYINKNLNNYDLDITDYELVFDISLLPKLDELEIFFLDKEGNLVNFNNVNINMIVEILEYVERIQNINTQNGQLF